MLALQSAGIVFSRDEGTKYKTYTRINLGVSTAFALGNERPNDALYHSKFNADHCTLLAIEAIYPQIKANETLTSIAKCQTLVDKVVDDEIEAGAMQKGSKITVFESASDAYDLGLNVNLKPVNATHNINMTLYIGRPSAISGE